MNLQEQLKNIKEERNALISKGNDAKSIEELDKIELDIRKKDLEIKRLESEISNEDVDKRNKEDEIPVGELRHVGGFNPISTYGAKSIEAEKRSEDEDVFASMEYRKAFKDYVLNGTPIPQEFRAETKVNDVAILSVVGNIGAVIPTTLMNTVIEDLKIEGKIFSRVRQITVQGGVEQLLSDFKDIKATWITSEENVSAEQKAEMDAKISFRYHVLESKIAVSLLASTVSLAVFEQNIIKALKSSMIRAIEEAIVMGDGNGKPLGFTKHDDLPQEQKISFETGQMGSFASWTRVEAAIPEAYENQGIILMNKQTWETYLNGMVDSVGQRLGLGKINEKGEKILNGRQVITTDYLPAFNNAKPNEIFGVVIDLNDYLLNTNLSMYYKKYFNEDTNKWVHKSLMIVDGKMSIGKVNNNYVGAKGLLYLTKGAK